MNKKRLIVLIIVGMLISVAVCLYASYRVSRSRSNQLIASIQDDYFLLGGGLRFVPSYSNFEGVSFYWVFHYEHSKVFDQNVYVQVNLLGNIEHPNSEELARWKIESSSIK